MDGFLLVDKPAGISSFGVVARVRWLISQDSGKKTKVGHTGTLDPAASGLLILVVGNWCKRAGEFSRLDKTYQAELTLGAVSTTADLEGEITKKSTLKPDLADIQVVLKQFLGQIEQTPPAFSAIKINGQRAYKLARAGKVPKLKPRQVTVRKLQITDYQYPKLGLVTEVSSGTYIRSLAEDIGQKLGTGAYLSALRRTKVGKFDIENALKVEDLSLSDIEKRLQK